MTQEEKAKAYDEAIEKFDVILNLNTVKESGTIFADDVRKIFPELKESEDERIRKELIFYLRYQHSISENFEDIGKWIAWLEKQNKKMSDQRYGILNKLIEADSIYQMVMNEEAKNKAIEALSKLEVSKLLGKLVDKTKPKFNVGDWIVHNERKNIVKVVNHTPFDYKVVSLLGYHHTITNDAIESNYHLWTIQDAKDGDILFHSDSASNGIFIFKELLKYEFNEKVICYCDYDSEDHFCLGEHHTCCWANDKILHPATKEQRDTLMKAMTDAGYTFDFEKKELKKIEQKHAEWSEEDEDILNTIINHFEIDLECTENDDIIKWLKSLRPQNKWKPSEGQLECLEYAIEKAEKDWSPLTNNRIYLTLKALKEQLEKL